MSELKSWGHDARTVLCTIGAAESLPVARRGDGALCLRFRAGPGLYQLSVVADARRFNWEELYITLDLYGNKGQRTGPWDFDLLNQHSPLIPSYWVELDGRRIGLWFFERVSLEDIEGKRFRGRTAFHVRVDGEHELALVPYRPMPVEWAAARLEVDPDDRLLPLPEGVPSAAKARPASRWGDEAFWAELSGRLATTHALYRAPLRRAFDWVYAVKSDLAQDEARRSATAEDIPMLIAAHHLDGRPGALERAMELVDHFTVMQYWGNPKTDGYSHNGDMGAAQIFRSLATAYHALKDRLAPERKARLLAKLALQGDIFLDLALINREYWGGSLLQDHGWTAMFAFGAGALNLRGVLPEAERWTAYVIPRLDRALAAMPRDGVIPHASYFSVDYYTEEVVHYRNALLGLTGRDLFDEAPFRPVLDWLTTALDERACAQWLYGHGDYLPLTGGYAFFNLMAARYGDARAARMHRLLLEPRTVEFYHSRQRSNHYYGVLSGFLEYDAEADARRVGPGPVVPRGDVAHLRYFADSGVAHYRDDALGIGLALRCGPYSGRHAYYASACSCDRLGDAPGAGHFVLFLGGKPLLVTPDAGYRLNTFLRSCLLVDGRGQYGDVGYTMSIPRYPMRGEEIESVRWDAASRSGSVRLNLRPAYPEESGLALYTREFVFTGARRILCRDHVLLDAPRRLAWLFQGKREDGVALEGLRARFGKGPCLSITPRGAEMPPLAASVCETEVVWGYSSTAHFKPFDHVRYETRESVREGMVEFEMTW